MNSCLVNREKYFIRLKNRSEKGAKIRAIFIHFFRSLVEQNRRSNEPVRRTDDCRDDFLESPEREQNRFDRTNFSRKRSKPLSSDDPVETESRRRTESLLLEWLPRKSNLFDQLDFPRFDETFSIKVPFCRFRRWNKDKAFEYPEKKTSIFAIRLITKSPVSPINTYLAQCYHESVRLL